MAGAIRMVSVSRGHDPRDFALFAFGGAGPLHAVGAGARTRPARVLVPARPGITNALGCVVADLRHDFVNTLNQPVAAARRSAASRAVLERHSDEGEALIAQGGGASRRRSASLIRADMQFVGQTHIINVPLPSSDVTRDELQALFEKAYFARFKVELPEIRANLVNLNTSVIGVRPAIRPVAADRPGGRAATLDEARREIRPVWFDGAGTTRRSIDREKLPLDARHRRARRSSSRWTPPPCSSPATGRTSTPTAIIIIEVGRHELHERLDAITLSVIQAALQQVCDEMDLTFSRAAFSPVIAEANDRSDGIYSADDGSLIAQGEPGPAGVRRRHAVFDRGR